MHKLSVIIASTREGRGGVPIGHWFAERARAHGGFEVELVDLAELHLPLLDEPEHPRFQKYTKEHTKRWSAIVGRSDAFVFVTPEYDFTSPASLVNALQFLAKEWAYKAVGLVSYGGVSGGLRSQEFIKPLIASLRMMPIPDSVSVQFYTKHIEGGVFTADKPHESSAKSMLDELARWTTALATLRAK